MGNLFNRLAKQLKETLFGKSRERKVDPEEKRASEEIVEDRISPVKEVERTQVQEKTSPPSKKPSKPEKRNLPRFLQVGFDFGTAYSKCIFRDVMIDRARIYTVDEEPHSESSFFIPSLFHFEDGLVGFPQAGESFHSNENISLLKMALSNAALGNLNDHSVKNLCSVLNIRPESAMGTIEALCFLFLTKHFSEIHDWILKMYPDFGTVENDSVFLNLAIPVSRVDEVVVRTAFEKVTVSAWAHRLEFHSQGKWTLEEIVSLYEKARNSEAYKSAAKECFLYPEVSANVQGYVRSPTSNTGIYVFCDTGAGTVDQSVFIFSRNQGESLAYLTAQVLPYGSTNIELRAFAEQDGNAQFSMEDLRKAKENNTSLDILDKARTSLRSDLGKYTLPVLARAKCKKLKVKSQIKQIALIFGGGGHCLDPYELGVRQAFSSTIFDQNFRPNSMGIPIPTDLRSSALEKKPHLFKRLTVAYGLSYPKYELAKYKLPSEMPELESLEKEPPTGNYFVDKDMV